MKTTYTNIEDLPLTLKAHEAAAVLRISKSKVYELAQSESFPAIRIGKRVVIPRDTDQDLQYIQKAVCCYTCVSAKVTVYHLFVMVKPQQQKPHSKSKSSNK